MRQQWTSIEVAAEDLGISERQAWRWLKQGRIRKKRSEDGRIVFVLVNEPADIADTDDTDNVTTDITTDTKPMSDVSRKLSARPESGLVKSMRDELEVAKVEFEIEKVEDARGKWQERKGREEKERAEQEKGQRLEELRVRETQRIQMEIEERERAIIQRVKEAVLPLSMKQVLPAHIMSAIYQEIEKILSRMNLVGVPEDELVILAKGIKDRVIQQNDETVRQALYEYFTDLARKGVKEVLKDLYNKYRMGGGELSLQDFLANASSSPDERERLLSLIAS